MAPLFREQPDSHHPSIYSTYLLTSTCSTFSAYPIPYLHCQLLYLPYSAYFIHPFRSKPLRILDSPDNAQFGKPRQQGNHREIHRSNLLYLLCLNSLLGLVRSSSADERNRGVPFVMMCCLFGLLFELGWECGVQENRKKCGD